MCAAALAAWDGSAALRAQSTPVAPRSPLPPVPSFEAEATPSELLTIPNPLPGTTTRTVLQPTAPLGPLPPPALTTPLTPEVILPDGSSVTLPASTKQVIRFAPRYGKLNDYIVDPIGDDVQRITYTGGLKVNVVMLPDAPGRPAQEIEFATDNAVIWVKGAKKGTDILGGIRTERTDADKKQGEKPQKMTIELYCSGNVVVQTRNAGGSEVQTIRAEELYYDLDKSRAVAIGADLETAMASGLDPVHIRSPEIWRLGPKEWRAFDTLVFSSKRPSDPALTIRSREATLTEQNIVRRNIFGRPYRKAGTGEIEYGQQRDIIAERNRFEILGVPFFAWPKYKADLSEPTGPFTNLSVGNNNIFGFTASATFDMYKLLSVRGAPGSTWSLQADYLSLRGPGLGTEYTYLDSFGTSMPNSGNFRAYGIYDKGEDVLGGFRGREPRNANFRGHAIWTHNQDLFENGTTYARVMGQAAYLSDKNFYEQYYKLRYDTDPNHETFAYLYGASGNFSWSALGEVNVNRPWVTETQWLPRVDAALTGESVFDIFLYSSRASAGYALLRPASQLPLPTVPTEAVPVDTARVDWNQRLSIPFDLGPARFEPYGVVDTSYYSRDLTGDDRGRILGAGGLRGSIPFSKLYADVNSELFNVRGLNHKVEWGANYYVAQASSSTSNLPLLDRLNDDSTDLSTRAFRSQAELYVPGADGIALRTSPRFDAQQYAIRRVLDNRPETLDTLQVVQAEVRQRLQTKRGAPGQDHTIDWMSLDLSASFYPVAERDNFGKNLAFLEYNFVWNWGDRTALSSSGWVDPFDPAARYFSVGAFYNRPDGSNLYLGYRHVDPVRSKAFIVALGYQLNSKYSVTATNVFDFGTQLAQASSLTFNRTGTDLTLSIGLTYSAIVNNFGFQILLLPNGAIARQPGQQIGSILQR